MDAARQRPRRWGRIRAPASMGTKTWRGTARHSRLPTLTSGHFPGATGHRGLNPTTATSTSAGPGNRMPSGHAAHATPPA
jgi:hypothetical protein